MENLPTNPFEISRNIGTITQINPSTAKANLPWASLDSAKHESGSRIGAGEVGEFVFIETDAYAVFGRITDVRLPDSERLTVEVNLGRDIETHPIGYIQLLSAIDLFRKEVCQGIPLHPRLGSKVYSAHESLVAWMIDGGNQEGLHINLAKLPHSNSTPVKIKPKHLFGRHCAVLGTTGGGKSYTLSQLLQSIDEIQGKVILLDPTGEFEKLGDNALHYCIGAQIPNCEEVAFPYTNLFERDLFAIFQPSPGSQTPKFREAIRSLKLLTCAPELGENGLLNKANKTKNAMQQAEIDHAAFLTQPQVHFDINKIAEQLAEECVWPSGFTNRQPDPSKYGDYNQQDLSYLVSLISRIEALISSESLSCIFSPGQLPNLTSKIDDFLGSDKTILRLSLEELSFEHNARELITNAIGRHLLTIARQGVFQENPVVVVLDEAHQFLNKSIGDDINKVRLDAFGLIAKEGRKYSLSTVISTQRPRDIPEDVLSQMGALIVHRLVNDRDREVVERACGDIDKTASMFLPTLAQGEALIVGVDFPIPMTVTINLADNTPESKDANYDKFWGV